MTWDAIGAIAELLAAFGVIFSLVFVGFQIRKSAELLRYSNLETSIDRTIASTSLLAANEALAELFLRGCADFDELTEVEKFRFGVLMTSLIADWWDQFLKYEDDRMGAEIWNLNRINMLGTLRQPGTQKWYTTTKGALPREFIQKVLEGDA